MANVPLRVYSHEIENLVESGHLDEAIAHCQHILKTYPMHMETYRLLGKAFLESRRYTDAADIFQRSLMAVPDDFVSHVGMSIIRDDEGKLDDAIWHMERAFEIQPSNPAIQGELRRLYGRRDGVEPPKIRLSRDALANMYSQGELFNQAIAEIRSVLAEDPNRPDLQIMLARANYRAGHKVEAAEMAAVLLKKYPYCMDALRILIDVIPASSNQDNLQVYRQRLTALDPYSSSATGSMFQTDQIPDTAVMIEQLEYASGNLPLGMQPNWASSLGIKLEEEKPSSETPAWLSESAASTAGPEPASDEVAPSADQTEEAIPDWMQNAGWQSAGDATAEQPVSFEPDAPAEPAAEAEIPDWLKSMAPPQAEQVDDAVAPPGMVDTGQPGDLPDWLKPATGAAPAGPVADELPAATSAESADQGLPDWLGPEPGTTGPSMDAPGAAFSMPAAGQADSAAPDIFSETPASVPGLSGPDEPQSDALPDWMRSLGGGEQPGIQPESPVVIPETPAVVNESEPGPLADLPVESREPPARPPLDDSQPFQPSGESKPLDIGDDALAWLESLAAKQGAKPEELLTPAEGRTEAMPDWLQDIRETPELGTLPPGPDESLPLDSGVPSERFRAAPADFQPIAETPQPVEAVPSQADFQEAESADTPDWLKELGGGHDQPGLALTEETPTDLPDWMKPAEEVQPASPEPQETHPSSLAPEPGGQALPESPAAPAAEAAQEDDITITSWLSKKDVARELESRGLSGDAGSNPSSDLPEWLQEMDKPVDQLETQDLRSEISADTGIPDWLRQPVNPPDAGAGVQEESKDAVEQAPWLDEASPIPQPPSPTTPEEWIPVDRHTVPLGEAEEMPPVLSSTPVKPPVEQPRVEKAVSGPPAPKPSGGDKDSDLLTGAREALSANSLEKSMGQYAKLIKKGRLLEDVLQDLRDAVYRHPVDVVVWQTLGDAYMRANRLQEALDAYTKAEDLLR